VDHIDDWAWGLSLIALTVAIHATGLACLAFALASMRARLEALRCSMKWRRKFAIFIGLIGAVGLLLAVLHGIEAAFWAATYLWLGALGSPEDAILFSIDSMATRGASGVILGPPWRLLGPLESTCGMLLFGISTAFAFAVIQFCWPYINRQSR
jgi:hypothetical protein